MKQYYKFLIVLFYLSAVSYTKAQTAVQSAGLYSSPSGGASINVTFGGNCGVGDLIVVHIDGGDNTKTVLSVVDNNGNTYIRIPNTHITWNTSWSGELWYTYNIVVAPNPKIKVTATFSGTPAVHSQLYINEYSGMLTSAAPLDQSTAAAGNALAVSTGFKTTLLANELIYGVGIGGGAGTIQVGAGFASNSAYAVSESNIVESQTQVAAGSYDAHFNNTVVSPWLAQMATFQTSISPLPIELLTFNAQPCNNQICLNWATATETNNDYFTIEKSKNGVNFDVVSKVNGAGNSTAEINYSATDNAPYAGVSYYRLKQTDYNGKYTYSNTISVNFTTSEEFHFNVYPNPSTSENINLAINASQGKQILVVVYDVTGREQYSKIVITQQQGENVFALDPSGKLTPGIYLITATSDDDVYSKKLIVQ